MKLSVPPSFVLPDLTGVLPGAIVAVLPTLRLRATYWDTPDLRLTRAGASLRYREGEGPARWTVKLPAAAPADGSLNRRELDFEGSPANVPGSAAGILTAYVRAARLGPVAQIESRRARLELRDRRGIRVAELDDDQVTVMDAGRPAAEFREVEIELAPGASPDVAEKVMKRLRLAGAGRPQPVSKVARALGPRAAEPPDLQIPDLSGDSRAGELLSACLARGMARLVSHDPGVRLGDDPEDLHQARVATRRLRSDLRSFAALGDPDWVGRLRAEVGWVARPLGRARDADVQLQRLWSQVAELPSADMSAAAVLLEELVREREAAGTEVAEMLDDPRYARFLDLLLEAIRAPVLTEAGALPAREVAPAMVGASWRRLRRKVKRAGRHPSPRELHQVRIAAKRCRYAAEAAALVVGRPAERLAARLADVQDVLGELQDAVVAEASLRARAQRLLTPDQAVVVGELVAIERAAVRDQLRRWPAVWEKASSKKLRRWLA